MPGEGPLVTPAMTGTAAGSSSYVSAIAVGALQ